MVGDVVVLLPPSEGKAAGGAGRAWRPESGRFGRRLAQARRDVLGALAATELGPAQLGAKGELLDRALAATAHLVDGRGRSLPAWQRYTGVVWQHLDPATLDDEHRQRILVPSALLGLVSALDPVPDHRLKFDVRLDGIGLLDSIWRPRRTEALLAATTAPPKMGDLLPNEHRNAIDLDGNARLRKRVHRPDLPQIGGHDGKAAKGLLARRILLGDYPTVESSEAY
jgi:cytoplasmic iron level regulating protein YaaA (DUF328/UPF0246 family)